MKYFLSLLFFVGIPVSTVWAGGSVTYEYDRNGNCTAITKLAANNAVLEKSTYEYDAYRRTTAYTEGTDQARTWKWHYDRYSDSTGLRDASTHTSKQWRVQVAPAFNAENDRSLTARKFDFNDRIVEEVTGMIENASGAWNTGPDTEVHHFSYDANGNKETFTDPRGRLTTYEYDLRDRQVKTIEPLNRVTETVYDATGNKTLVKFPDTRTQQWLDYDGFGQAGRFIDERNNTTNLIYQWGPMKKLHTVTTHRDKDGGGTEDQPTTFEPDGLGRPHKTIFPDNSTEETTYQFDQVKEFKTRKNQTKTISYDARGREIFHSFSGDAAPGISRSWDDANRVLTLCNIYSTIDYVYDVSGRVLSEGNAIAGSGGRRLTIYHHYADGVVSDIQYPDGMWIHRDYTARGQLKTVEDSVSGPVIDYTYFPDGKVDHADYGNGTTTAFGYDGRGMISSVQHKKNGTGQNLSYREYFRDTRDRIYAFRKSTSNNPNPMENGRGDRFSYDEEGQLVEAWYDASDPANSGTGNSRYDGFNYDAMGNRRQNNHLARWGWTSFARRDNGLNQYLDWGGTPINHEANGEIVQDGWITASYNALNQPVSMTSPTSGGTMWFGYDPAGRCVKRWVGPSGAATSNPATYLYYDGWNLIEEGSSATSPSRNYVHGGRVDEIVLSLNLTTGEQAYHQYDARTHTILLTNSSGGILEQYEYDVFGQPYVFAANGTSMGESQYGNRFLFTGREWLKGLDIYDYRHRLYQPELGRFLQPDPKHFEAGDYNLYRYCHNDPINKNDPFGLVDKDYAEPTVWSQNYNPTDRVVVAGHGNSTDGLVINNKSVLPSTVAKDVIAAGYGESKNKVEISVCGTGVGGKDSFAQKVANELAARTGVKPDVVAPDGNTANRTTVGDQSGKINAHPPEAQATKKGESGEMKHFTAEPKKKDKQ